MIKKEDRDSILEAVDLSGLDKLIERDGIQLSKRGMRRYARCPFHDDKGPSFVVWEAAGEKHSRYWCFGCHKGGDAITWMMDFHGMDYTTACRTLAKEHGVAITEEALTPEEQEALSKEENMRVALEAASRWFEQRLEVDLNSGGEVSKILAARGGYSTDALKTYRLGVSGERREMTAAMEDYPVETLKAADLVRWDERWREYQDKFGRRIMFPYVVRGKVVGFTGRRILSPGEKTNFKYEIIVLP